MSPCEFKRVFVRLRLHNHVTAYKPIKAVEIADTLYSLLARKLRGFENCDAPKIYRLFVKGKARVSVSSQKLTVTFPRKAHNPILRSAPWHQLPQSLSWLNGAGLELKFK